MALNGIKMEFQDACVREGWGGGLSGMGISSRSLSRGIDSLPSVSTRSKAKKASLFFINLTLTGSQAALGDTIARANSVKLTWGVESRVI
jgi:hypothetical protein